MTRIRSAVAWSGVVFAVLIAGLLLVDLRRLRRGSDPLTAPDGGATVLRTGDGAEG